MNDTLINGHTAEQWEAMAVAFEEEAKRWHQAKEASWERSDTDGFLSQWASGLTSQLNSAKVEWARNHGYVSTNVLLTTDGQIASTHQTNGMYGPAYVLRDEFAESYGKRFFNLSKASTYAKKGAAHRKKGFVVARVQVAGQVKIMGSGTGLSGAANAYVGSQPSIDALKNDDFVITNPDLYASLSEEYDDPYDNRNVK